MPRRMGIWLVFGLLLSSACKSKDRAESADMAPASSARLAKAMVEKSKEAARGGRPPTTKASAPSSGGEASATPKSPVPAARKVIYAGELKLRATDARATLEKAVALTEKVSGYVEQLTATSAVLRVPAAEFRPTFAKLVELGPVLDRKITAEDVTDAFTALELRIGILSASRARLMALLAKTTDVAGKLALLADVRRLTDEIDQLERRRHAYASLIQFARISLSLVAPDAKLRAPADEPVAAFRWLRSLSPFNHDVAARGRKAKLRTPDGLVLLEGDVWKAEGAEGTTLWAHKRDNEPRGTTEFWAEALRARLGPEYAAAEAVDLGPFKGVRLLHLKEGTAYRYLVAVRADGDSLVVAEAHFPDEAQEKRHGDAIRAAIAGGVL